MKSWASVLRFATISAIVLVSLVPFYALLYLSLKTPTRTFFDGALLAPDFHVANFADAWRRSNIGWAMVNSLVITACAVTLVVVLAASAGFSIARFGHAANRAINTIFLVCLTIPAIIITVPLYTLMRAIGGINTHWAMILLMASGAMPFAVFLYTGFVRTLPREVEESAIIDGCSPFGAFWRVTFAMLRPATAAVVILQGLGIWNNYGQAVFFLQSQSMRTVPLAVSMFFQQYGAKWHLMAAAAIIGLAPAVLAFLIFQRFFIKGITAGAVKG